MERDLSEISGFEASHTRGQRWGRVCHAVEELTALMKEITSVSKHLKKSTEDYNYENKPIKQDKKCTYTLKNTHHLHNHANPRALPFPHITKSNFIVYAIILHMFAGNRSHQCLGSECPHFLFFDSLVVFLLSHPIVRHHTHRICHLNGSASSPVYCKNMKLLPPSDPCILTTVM